MPAPPRQVTWRIRSACLKLHTRRVTAVDFPPHSLNLVASACKKGLISVWDFEEVWIPPPAPASTSLLSTADIREPGLRAVADWLCG